MLLTKDFLPQVVPKFYESLKFTNTAPPLGPLFPAGPWLLMEWLRGWLAFSGHR